MISPYKNFEIRINANLWTLSLALFALLSTAAVQAQDASNLRKRTARSAMISAKKMLKRKSNLNVA